LGRRPESRRHRRKEPANVGDGVRCGRAHRCGA
jgi:hypothetical protein